uniref:Outer membrane protein beta-barrel domain-containing protein n=1 Tax=uncultured bacterium fosmid pJB135F11 TaxID=1478051 RepID=A0A0H3U8L1_9BACT|nr:hypothetical protein [uncultured bacterium fosmid pJB135F11]
MKNRIGGLLLLWLCAGLCMAQKIVVSGSVIDAVTTESLPGATVVLLQPKDSTQVTGAATDLDGNFSLPAVKSGNYIFRVSFVGYQPVYKDLKLTKANKEVEMGEIPLEEDAQMLKEAEITAKAAMVEMKEDTFQYNSEAYRLPEGAALEELVRKLPGAEVGDDGTIKINGKTVNKIMVEGKEFFNNDTKMAMKNLPSKMVKKIKAYDKKSDYTRITGIDDGEEETVLDLTVKKGMREGWLLNTDLGYGTEDRYTGKVNLNRFNDHSQYTVIGSINNVNDQGFPGGGGRGWGGGGGIVTSKMAGANFAWENGKKENTAGYLEMGGNVRYSHNHNNSETKSNSETFLDEVNSTFSNNMSKSSQSNANVNANFRIEWMPDSMTNLMFRPNFSHSESHGHNNGSSVTFNSDPYEFMNDPLKQYNMEENRMIRDSIAVNDRINEGKNEGSSNSVDGFLQLNRRLAKAGRNITLDLGGAYNNNESKSFSRSEINYFQRGDENFTNQYNLSPSTSYNFRERLSYSEPIFAGFNLQMSYQFQYRFSDNDRSMYSIDSLLANYGGYYTKEQLYLGYIPGLDSLEYCRNLENSQYATYKEYNHDASLMFRRNVGENRLNFGVSFQPQTTHMDYEKNRLDTTVVRNTFNWSPRVDYRWKISNTSQLRVRFRGWMNQPSMTDLLEVTNSADPLNISTGNAGLRSSWSNRFNVFYNDYIADKQMGWMVNADVNQTRNGISTATIYNMETGGKYTRPMNISGNWDAGGALMFNTAIDPNKYFNIHTFTNLRYNNSVGYLSSENDGSQWDNYLNADGSVNMNKLFSMTELEKATTKSTNVGENLRAYFRNDLLEIGLNGGFNYQHARNAMQKNANLDNWTFNYGGNVQINMPWNMAFNSDISQQSRRGYDDASMNTNELIWNAQLSQSFLKDNAATVSVQWYDILHERSSISRNISATMRSDSWNNAIHSYLMVHLIYKLNLLGSKEARAEGFGGWGGGPGGGHGPGGGGFGGPRGGGRF